MNILLLLVVNACSTTKNHTVTSKNQSILPIKFLPLTTITVLIVPSDTSIIRAKNIYIHSNTIFIKSPLLI